MRKLLSFFMYTLAFATVCLTSCSGNSDETDTNGGMGKLELRPSKTVIEASGQDKVVFTVYDANGIDVTNKAYVMDMQTGLDLKKENGYPVFTAIANGEYEFEASVGGDHATATVTAQNRKLYEEFYRRVAVFKITGTWCVNCPSMTSALAGVDKKMPGRLVKMAFHYTTSGMPADPYESPLTDPLFRAFNVLGAPSAIYNLDVMESSRLNITDIINTQLRENPATCGIKVKAYTQGNEIKVDASLKSSKGGKYDLVYILLQDGLPGGVDCYEDRYDYTVVAGSSNLLYPAENEKTVGKDEEATFPTWTFDKEYLKSGGTKVRVAVYALTEKDGRYIADNIAECEVDGAEVDYKYND